MATADCIPAFPSDINREAFGHWLSGFTDGEGTFMTGVKKKGATGFNVLITFGIMLRDDDDDILKLIQSFFGCGHLKWYGKCGRKIPNAKPICAYRVCLAEDLERTIIPHFERYPLRAKKRSDFLIWKECVHLVGAVKRRKCVQRSGPKQHQGRGGAGTLPKWTDAEKEHLNSLSAALRQQRVYTPKPASKSSTCGPDTTTEFLECDTSIEVAS